MLSRTKYNRIVNCTLDQLTTHLAYRTCGIRLACTSTSGQQPDPHSDAKLRWWATPCCFHPHTTHRDSIELVAASATSPGTTRFETLPLEDCRRRDRRTSLDRNRVWHTPAVTLHHAENGIQSVCHGSLQKIHNVSLSERLPIHRDIRTLGLVFEANPQIHRLP